MLFFYLQKKLPALLIMTTTFMVLASLFAATQALERQGVKKEQAAYIPVTIPSSPPHPSQESVDLALKLFKIDVPHGIHHPVYDASLSDRGITSINGFDKDRRVKIGPGAFTSWGMLGSTLAHEIEVHGKQNFSLIRFKDLIGLQGTVDAEREAYLHEVKHSTRFGLTPMEINSIVDTMNFYYPKPEGEDSLVLSQTKRGFLDPQRRFSHPAP